MLGKGGARLSEARQRQREAKHGSAKQGKGVARRRSAEQRRAQAWQREAMRSNVWRRQGVAWPGLAQQRQSVATLSIAKTRMLSFDRKLNRAGLYLETGTGNGKRLRMANLKVHYKEQVTFTGIDLIRVRNELGLSQEVFAEKCGWTQQYQSRLEIPESVHVLDFNKRSAFKRAGVENFTA